MKTRIIGAAILLIVFVPLLLLGGLPYSIFMCLLSLFGLHELLRMKRSKNNKVPFMIELFAYIIVGFLTLNNYDLVNLSYVMDYRLIAALVLVFLTPLVFVNDVEKYGVNDALYLIGSTLFIGLSFNMLILVRNYSLNYIFYLFLITTMSDTFAYLIGMNIGKHKLAPKISPKKTIEGTIGGTIMGTFIATMFFVKVVESPLNLGVVIFMTVTLSLLGQIGDLVFSFIKREYAKKDFSNLIPGHGGILDRLDSIIFAVLGFLLFLVVL